jgi:hypothetical protein
LPIAQDVAIWHRSARILTLVKGDLLATVRQPHSTKPAARLPPFFSLKRRACPFFEEEDTRCVSALAAEV